MRTRLRLRRGAGCQTRFFVQGSETCGESLGWFLIAETLAGPQARTVHELASSHALSSFEPHGFNQQQGAFTAANENRIFVDNDGAWAFFMIRKGRRQPCLRRLCGLTP